MTKLQTIHNAFQKVGFNYYSFGERKHGRKKLFDYWKADKVTDAQVKELQELLPTLAVLKGHKEFAPEIKFAVVAIPPGPLHPKLKANRSESEQEN